MTYETVEAGLQFELRATSTLTDEQVTLGDWRILGTGQAQVAIIEYQGFESDFETYGQKVLTTWTARINLLVKYTVNADATNLLRDVRQEIINKIHEKPKLNDTAFDSRPVSGSVAPEKIEVGGVSFMHEWIMVEIEELVAA